MTSSTQKLEVDEYGAPIPPLVYSNDSPPDFGLTPDAYSSVDTYTPRRMMRSRQSSSLLRRMAREADNEDVADDKIDLDESTLNNNTTVCENKTFSIIGLI